MEKEWSELKIITSPHNQELVTNALIICQITGIETLSDNKGLAIYLPSKQLNQKWVQKFQDTLEQLGLNSHDYRLEVISNVNWHWGKQWAQYYQPVQVSHFIRIIPSWQPSLANNQYDILINPEESFGSGEHTTTKLCLQAMEEFLINQKSLIDVGTGTGILAIAGYKLGIKKIKAYDISQAAIEVARQNFKLNLNSNDLDLELKANSLLDNLNVQADIITANMLEEPIRELIPTLYEHLNYQGLVIISGILAIKMNAIVTLLNKSGLKIIQTTQSNNWGCLVAQKRS